MAGRASIDSHEHTAKVALVMVTMICQRPFQQHQASDRLNQVHEVVARLRHDTPSLVLSVRTLVGFQGQRNAHVFLQPKESRLGELLEDPLGVG